MTRGRRQRSAGPAAMVLAAVVTLGGCTSGDDEPSIATPPVGAAAGPACELPTGPPATGPVLLPDLTLPCLAGGDPVSLRRLTGTPAVVNLWASWCAPCREELPAFTRLQAAAGDRLRVVGVATTDRPGAARSYAADAGLPFPSLEDRDGELLRGVGRRGLPVTVLVGADGAVAEVYTGRPLTDAALRELVRRELGVDVG